VLFYSSQINVFLHVWLDIINSKVSVNHVIHPACNYITINFIVPVPDQRIKSV
jgi:hypothetical protein